MANWFPQVEQVFQNDWNEASMNNLCHYGFSQLFLWVDAMLIPTIARELHKRAIPVGRCHVSQGNCTKVERWQAMSQFHHIPTPALPIPIKPIGSLVSLGGGNMPRLVLKNVTKSGTPTRAMLWERARCVSRTIFEYLDNIYQYLCFVYQTYHGVAAVCREIAAIWREKLRFVASIISSTFGDLCYLSLGIPNPTAWTLRKFPKTTCDIHPMVVILDPETP